MYQYHDSTMLWQTHSAAIGHSTSTGNQDELQHTLTHVLDAGKAPLSRCRPRDACLEYQKSKSGIKSSNVMLDDSLGCTGLIIVHFVVTHDLHFCYECLKTCPTQVHAVSSKADRLADCSYVCHKAQARTCKAFVAIERAPVSDYPLNPLFDTALQLRLRLLWLRNFHQCLAGVLSLEQTH